MKVVFVCLLRLLAQWWGVIISSSLSWLLLDMYTFKYSVNKIVSSVFHSDRLVHADASVPNKCFENLDKPKLEG